jgi:hypothetical protein
MIWGYSLFLSLCIYTILGLTLEAGQGQPGILQGPHLERDDTDLSARISSDPARRKPARRRARERD